jgi:hypothetical protein
MGNKTSKNYTPPLARVNQQPPHSDSMFIAAAYKGLLQFSIRQRKVIKDYGRIMYSDISTLRTTPDKKYLFLGYGEGF